MELLDPDPHKFDKSGYATTKNADPQPKPDLELLSSKSFRIRTDPDSQS